MTLINLNRGAITVVISGTSIALVNNLHNRYYFIQLLSYKKSRSIVHITCQRYVRSTACNQIYVCLQLLGIGNERYSNLGNKSLLELFSNFYQNFRVLV